MNTSKKGVTIGQVQRIAEAAWCVLNHDNDPHDGQAYNTANWHALTRAIRAELEKQQDETDMNISKERIAFEKFCLEECFPRERPSEWYWTIFKSGTRVHSDEIGQLREALEKIRTVVPKEDAPFVTISYIKALAANVLFNSADEPENA